VPTDDAVSIVNSLEKANAKILGEVRAEIDRRFPPDR
jgi:hypothetical protein